MDAYSASNREAQLAAVVRSVDAAGQRQKDLAKLIEVTGSCPGIRRSPRMSEASGPCPRIHIAGVEPYLQPCTSIFRDTVGTNRNN